MKFRNGFVSNSSSSSFVLAYDKSNVLSGPEAILEFIKQNPEAPVIFYGWDLGEGDDIFELSKEQKSAIRRYPKEFIAQNQGTVKTWEPENDHPIIGYGNATLVGIQEEWDWGQPDEEAMKKKLAHIKDSSDFGRDWLKRENIPEERIETKVVEVCNRSCAEDYAYDYDFLGRYFTAEDQDEYDYGLYSIKRHSKLKPRPYGIWYDTYITEKDQILRFLETINTVYNGDITKVPTLLISWNCTVLNEHQDLDNIDLFTIGEEEYKYILDHKQEFLDSPKEIVLFIGGHVYFEGTAYASGSCSLGFGKVYIAEAGANIPDFIAEIFTDEEPEYPFTEEDLIDEDEE